MTSSTPSTSNQNGAQMASSSTPSCPDPDDVAVLTMRKAMGALLDNVGFTHAQEGPLNVITDVAVRFMEKLCKEVKLAGEYCGRSQPAMDDLSHAFSTMKFDRIDFHAYLEKVSSIAPIPPLPLFPVDAPKCHRINGYKASREEKASRPEHIPRFMPGIRPSGEEREDAHVAIPSTSTAVDLFDNLASSFEKSRPDYLSRFEGDVPGFCGADATNYGMKKTDKDKNPPVLVVMKGRKTEEERRKMEEEERIRRETEQRSEVSSACGTNGIHHKFKKHKEKDKDKSSNSSRPPSTLKGIGKPAKEKTPHKIKKEDKSRTNTPIIKENASLVPSDLLHFGGTTPIKSTPVKNEKMDRDQPKPLLSLNLFDDPAEETDIPLPRTPGRDLIDSPEDQEEPLFFDADPFGRMAFNGPSTSTPFKNTPTMKDEEKRRKEKEEKRARKEEKKAKKVADEVKRIEMEKAAEKEAMKEAQRVAAREEAKERERAREKSREQQRLEKERKEKLKEEQRRAEQEMQRMLDEKKEQIRLQAAQLARTITEDNERKLREKEAKEKKRKEEKERAKIEERKLLHAAKKEAARRSATPRVDTPKPRELEAIRVEEDKDDSSTIPCVMEDIPDSVLPPSGPTSFPLNMSMMEPTTMEERTVTPIKIKKHGEGERDGEKIKKKHKKDKKEKDDDKDSCSNRDDEERRERKKAKKREKKEREERERLQKEKRVDQSPIQDKIDPNKSTGGTGLKLTIKLGGVSSQTHAPPSFVSTSTVPAFPASANQPSTSSPLLKLKIKTPIDHTMETAASSSSSLPVHPPPIAVVPKPRPVTKAELKATPESAPSLFQEERTWKHKHKKHKHAKASGSDSSSSSDEEERKERERRRKAKKEKERMEREREREEEERRIREKERREREKEREERERLERVKAEKEARERIEREKREREREKEREKEKQKKKQTAFDLALQSSPEKKKRKKEEEKVEVIWICPVCSVAYVDGAEMIGCDCCDSWFHWQCVGLVHVPEGDAPWFCERCTPKNGELPNYGKNKKKCTHWSGQYEDWNITKVKKSRDYSP